MKTDGWQERFWKRIADGKKSQFVWGTHDCVMFATACIQDLTEIDYYTRAMKRYPYATEEEARALMVKHKGVTGLAASFLGDPIAWGSLGMGDVVVCGNLPFVDMEVLCVHDGSVLLAPAKSGGLARIPFRYAFHGWRV